MKKLLMLIIIVLLLGLLAGGIGFLSDGFNDWNVKDWFKKEKTSELATPDSIANISDWSITYGEGDSAFVISNETEELVVSDLSDVGKGGKRTLINRGNMISCNISFQINSVIEISVSFAASGLNLLLDKFVNENVEEWNVVMSDKIYSNPLGLLQSGDSPAFETAYEAAGRPKLLGYYLLEVSFVKNENIDKVLSMDNLEKLDITLITSFIPVIFRG